MQYNNPSPSTETLKTKYNATATFPFLPSLLFNLITSVEHILRTGYRIAVSGAVFLVQSSKPNRFLLVAKIYGQFSSNRKKWQQFRLIFATIVKAHCKSNWPISDLIKNEWIIIKNKWRHWFIVTETETADLILPGNFRFNYSTTITMGRTSSRMLTCGLFEWRTSFGWDVPN